MSSSQLRLGAFGVGRMGRVHVENLVRLANSNEIAFAAIGDRYAPTLDATMAMVERLGGAELAANIKTFDCPEKMAKSGLIDATVVASRTSDHARDSLAFFHESIPVMVEKPMAKTVTESAEFADALGGKSDQFVQIAFQRYYDAAAQTAMQWISQGYLGELQQSQHVIQDKNPTPVGYESCGMTADMAIHLIFESMSFHDFELPRYVQALRFSAPHYEDRANEGANVVHCFCSWADGSLAQLWGSRLNATGYDNGFKLIGTEGRIDVGDFVGDFGEIKATLWRGTSDDGQIARGTLTESLSFPMSQPQPEHPDFYARYATAYADELNVFLQHVRDNTPFELGLEIGWKTLLVANLADLSSRQEGQRFELAFKGRPIETVHDAAQFAASIGLE